MEMSKATFKEGMTLEEYKDSMYSAIDLKTNVLIGQGFVYDSTTFSLSIYAQTNWHTIKNQTSEFTFPLDISTIDNNEYSLAEANVAAFWDAGKTILKGHLDSGRDLKKSVFDAVDKSAVDAIIDNR